MSERQPIRRRAQDAATRFGRVVSSLCYDAEHAKNESARWLTGYEASELLWKVLLDAKWLVDALNEGDDRAELERAARAVYETLRARRLASALEQVEGRTPEEAEAFQAKARELRGEA